MKKTVNKSKKRHKDPNYRPGSTNSSINNTNILNLRTETKREFVDNRGRKRKLKTAVMINKNFLDLNLFSSADAKIIQAQFERELIEIETDRPISKVIACNKQGIPQVVRTPRKSKLVHFKDDGILYYYSNNKVSHHL